MNLHKVLTVGGVIYPLCQDETRLDLHAPGRASYTITATTAVSGLVTLDIGYNDAPLQRHFLGYVERCTSANGQQQVLLCRELAAALDIPLPLTLRHVDLRGVLGAISERNGLSFRVPAQAYARVKTAYFFSLASGYQALDSLGKVFGIADYIWQQQGDGEIFAGSWAHSFWGERPALPLPTELFDSYHSNQSATIAALPGLRPGASINQGERITSVMLAGSQMAIKWKK
jgi:hypothetical protein